MIWLIIGFEFTLTFIFIHSIWTILFILFCFSLNFYNISSTFLSFGHIQTIFFCRHICYRSTILTSQRLFHTLNYDTIRLHIHQCWWWLDRMTIRILLHTINFRRLVTWRMFLNSIYQFGYPAAFIYLIIIIFYIFHTWILFLELMSQLFGFRVKTESVRVAGLIMKSSFGFLKQNWIIITFRSSFDIFPHTNDYNIL